MIELDIQTKIRLAETYAHISETELCKRIGTSPQNFFQRLKVGKFSDEDFKNIGDALGATITTRIEFPDGYVIE